MKLKLQDPRFTDCFQSLCNSLTWFYKTCKSKFFCSEWFGILPFSLQLALAHLWFWWQCSGHRHFYSPAQGKLIWNTDHKHSLKLNPTPSHQGVAEKLVHETCQFKECLRFVLAQGWASLMSQTIKNLPTVQETQTCSPGEGVATSSRILWTEESGRQVVRVGRDWETDACTGLPWDLTGHLWKIYDGSLFKTDNYEMDTFLKYK